jgi:hypothetical protein
MIPRTLAAALAIVSAAAALAAQGLPAPAANEYGRVAKLEVQPFEAPGKQVRLEYPKKDWQVVPGGSSAIASLLQRRGEAAVVIEQSRLNQALAQDDITDLFGQIESDTIRDRQPSPSDIQSKVYEAGGRRFVIVDYARQGVAGPERVRQYSIPMGSDLYRLTCSAPASSFTRYETVFAHIAATFAVNGASTH